jgi:hypothetical protein
VTYLWVAIALYLTGYLASLKPLAAGTLERLIARAEAEIADNKRTYPTLYGHLSDTFKVTAIRRHTAARNATILALFWPITLTIHHLAAHTVAPTERARALQTELDQARKLAEANNLEWPNHP